MNTPHDSGAAGRSSGFGLPTDIEPSAPQAIYIDLTSGLGGIPPHEWNSLFDPAYPFTQYDFLSALEQSGCVGNGTGWQPCHLLARDDAGRLVGAVPLYLKQHSYGEFVFDFAWANASHRAGLAYYPKLVCAVPFVPSTGPRIGAINDTVRSALVKALLELPAQHGASSVHLLFVDKPNHATLEAAGALPRHDIQFQWFDRGYGSFESFVASLASEKRKKLLRERRRVAESGIRFMVRPGDDLSSLEWERVYALYANTYEERGQPPYLTPEFFEIYGRRTGNPLRIIMGHDDKRLVAAALTLQGADTLYGRHWGAADHYHSLHFECCYYQGLEFCLREGLQRYDAGTQGEHKLSRGFEPVKTLSYHSIAFPPLADAIADFLIRERDLVHERYVALQEHLPFRHPGPSSPPA